MGSKHCEFLKKKLELKFNAKVSIQVKSSSHTLLSMTLISNRGYLMRLLFFVVRPLSFAEHKIQLESRLKTKLECSRLRLSSFNYNKVNIVENGLKERRAPLCKSDANNEVARKVNATK